MFLMELFCNIRLIDGWVFNDSRILQCVFYLYIIISIKHLAYDITGRTSNSRDQRALGGHHTCISQMTRFKRIKNSCCIIYDSYQVLLTLFFDLTPPLELSGLLNWIDFLFALPLLLADFNAEASVCDVCEIKCWGGSSPPPDFRFLDIWEMFPSVSGVLEMNITQLTMELRSLFFWVNTVPTLDAIQQGLLCASCTRTKITSVWSKKRNIKK